MDPQTGGLEAFIDRVRDLASASGCSVAEASAAVQKAIASLASDGRPLGLGATGIGRELVEGAARAQAAQHVKDLLNAGVISFVEARRRLGFDGEDDEMTRRSRRWEREAVPPAVVPIMGFLRVNRDPQRMKTSVYFKDGTLLLDIDEMTEKRPIGQIIADELVPRICSGCGEIKETPLCESCRAEAIADLGDVLRG